MKKIDLSGEWTLRRASTGETCPAPIPGDTHSALLAAGKIPDPYYGTNELDVQWVGREDWIYERGFEAGRDFLEETAVFLECEGLDTLAEISLNGSRIGNADNMFRRWRFNAKPFLKPGYNRISIRLFSAEAAAASEAAGLPYPLPHSMYPVQSPHRNLVRKAQCHAGWDWGPCLMVAGVYGEIFLGATSSVRVDHLYTEQKHGKGSCRVRITAECEVFVSGRHDLNVDLQGISSGKTVYLAKGRRKVSLDLLVEEPKLWWPNGLGDQPLYALDVELGGHRVKKRIGLRTLELVTRGDRRGASMFFRVNGVDVFCKGANWIPMDALPTRCTRRRLATLLRSAAAAHMNMLRVWGGGLYETDGFYDLCDEMGIMVWQDMMFACALYPSTPAFLRGVDAEIRYQVKRLRDHPCIALWCGNNENLGSLSQFPESIQNRDRYLVDYDRLYEGVIGRAVEECDPTRRYWPSSPCGGPGQFTDNWHDDRRGDMHFWTVWHEDRSFEAYASVSPRFCSEFGYQSFPSLKTIAEFAPKGSFNPTSPVLEHHQRAREGNSKIMEMFGRYFRFPEKFENFVYLSQVQQVLAIKTAVELWRRLRPGCMGTLYWQLNDNWPASSWSSIEYGEKWKPLHYAAVRFYAPVILAAIKTGGEVELWAVNDLREDAVCVASASVMDFSGQTLSSEVMELRIPAGSALEVKKYPLSALAPAPDRCFLLLTLRHGGKTAVNELFFTEFKRCELAKPEIRTVVSRKNGLFHVRLETDRPAFFVSLEARGIEGEFDDNCFTLVKEMPKELVFTPGNDPPSEGSAEDPADFANALEVRHLRDTYP